MGIGVPGLFVAEGRKFPPLTCHPSYLPVSHPLPRRGRQLFAVPSLPFPYLYLPACPYQTVVSVLDGRAKEEGGENFAQPFLIFAHLPFLEFPTTAPTYLCRPAHVPGMCLPTPPILLPSSPRWMGGVGTSLPPPCLVPLYLLPLPTPTPPSPYFTHRWGTFG